MLLITSRNIYEANGEYALISRRSKALKNSYNIDTDIIGFQSPKRITKELINRDKGIWYNNIFRNKISLKSLPSDILYIISVVKNYFKENQPKNILISGWLLFFLYKTLLQYKQKNKCKIYYDMHGCVEELLEYPHPRLKYRFLSKIYYEIASYFERKMLSLCDGVLVVSESMRQYSLIRYKEYRNLVYYTVPCGLDDIHNENEILDNRLSWRSKLGINEQENVFVYSGGVSSWQLVNKIVDLYEKVLSNNFEKSKMVFFTSDIEYVETVISQKRYNKKNYLIISVDSRDLTAALAACDVGILLRENNFTNNVAFPNKYSEYVGTGLTHIVSKSLTSPSFITNKYKIGCVAEDDFSIDINILKAVVDKRKDNILSFYKMSNIILKAELSYSKNLRSFANILKD